MDHALLRFKAVVDDAHRGQHKHSRARGQKKKKKDREKGTGMAGGTSRREKKRATWSEMLSAPDRPDNGPNILHTGISYPHITFTDHVQIISIKSCPQIISTHHIHKSHAQIISTDHIHKSYAQIISTDHIHRSYP